MTDTRVWMYRDGEAVCFASREIVPECQGWTETPAPRPESQAATERKAPADGKPETLEILRARATELGIHFHRNTGAARLAKLIEKGPDNGVQS